MTNFPLTSLLGLKTMRACEFHADSIVINPKDLERVLDSAPKAFCFKDMDEDMTEPRGWNFGNPKYRNNTHTARLLCIQELKPKEPMKQVVETLVRFSDHALFPGSDLINKFKGKRVRVTVESIDD